MLDIDFARHNAMVERLWKDFWAGRADRTPMILGMNSRMVVLNPALNARGHTFERIFNDPAAMLEAQADFIDWSRLHLIRDQGLGPVKNYALAVSFLNSYDALYFGAPLHFRDGQLPDTAPFLDDDRKGDLFGRDFSDPLSNPWVARSIEFRDYMLGQKDRWSRGDGRIGSVAPAFLGNDGPFTIACALRPPDQLMTDLIDEPEYVDRLLDFITGALVHRIRTLRVHYGLPPRDTAGYSLADDAVMMLSPAMYRRFVLPCHRRLIDELADREAIAAAGGRLGIHLCGAASHLFGTIRDELGVTLFDTGFPIDHGRVRDELGEEVWIQGGPPVAVLKDGTPRQVFDQTRRILESGVKRGRRFVLREGNNLAPCTPEANVEAMYQACLQFGRFD